MPVPNNFKWPAFAFIALYEHSGEEREANARATGEPACSVADRRSIQPPSEGCWHFIGTVQDFVEAYPHPIRRQSNHVTCGSANWGSWKTWKAKLRDGSMRQAAEEFLWANCLGDRSLGEQPPTAHQHTVGPPTYIVNGHQFGAPDKTYYKWARNLPPVAPTNTLPAEQRWSELAVVGSAEAKMVKRSYTPRTLAVAEARAHAQYAGGDATDFGRPANQPCRGYQQMRAQLAHNFGLFSAHYAQTVSEDWLRLHERQDAIIMVPVAYAEKGICAMVDIRTPSALFGAPRDAKRSGADQGEAIAEFISGGLPTQYAAPWVLYEKRDVIVLVPWATAPITTVDTPQQRELAAAAGLSAAWCTLAALQDHLAYRPAGLALGRVAALAEAGRHGAQQAGTWITARPLVHFRTARKWAQRVDELSEKTTSAKACFMAAEAERGIELRSMITALDAGDGELRRIAENVVTAADLQHELPFPSNGLPDFSDARLRLRRFAERPLNLSTSWLARLPPQQVPPGFTPMTWRQIMRGWMRRRCCNAMNKTADRDFECWTQGDSARPRPAYECIGPGGGKLIAHADGIGSYNALSIVYEQVPGTELYDKMDYQREGRTHWVLEMLKKIFGTHDDRQLMSLIMHGVRWGVAPPMQTRIAPQLERLDSRIRGVGAAFKKLLDKGLYYKMKRLRRAHERIEPDGPCPFIVIPPYVIGSGGTDKADNPSEARIVGDQSAPHRDQGVRERNAPHGEPDGPVAVSMNDLMGPQPGGSNRGKMLDPAQYPMPHPEIKVRPRQCYGDNCVLRHMAHAAGTYLAAVKDDGRHMFFQFEMSPEEDRTCSFQVVIELPRLNADGDEERDADGNRIMELWFVLIVATCMNMGSRNASKIAQRFTDRLLEGFSQELDVFVRDVWLQKQTPALQSLIAERSAKLGRRQARPYATAGYTDDYKFTYVGPELTAEGTAIWRRLCKQSNYWLSAKSGAGTVVDFIGGREVLNGGFGCLPPSKHARAIADTEAAIAGALSRDALESHNSFLVHVHEWLDFPVGTLKGLSAPLKMHFGTGDEQVSMTESVTAQFKAILHLLHTRNAASFWSGIDEAGELRERGIIGTEGIMFAPRFASDSCSDVEHPHICGMAGGLFFRFPLEGEWRHRHITLTEACGTVLCIMIFPKYFPKYELMVEGDATAALAAAVGTASSEDLIYLRRRAEQEPTYSAAALRAWITHVAGWGNGPTDAGSRDKMKVMHDLAKAFGIRLREVPIPPEALNLMADVLENTRDVTEVGSTARGTHNLNMTGDMPVAEEELCSRCLNALAAIEQGLGLCPACYEDVNDVEVMLDEDSDGGEPVWLAYIDSVSRMQPTWRGSDVIAELGGGFFRPRRQALKSKQIVPKNEPDHGHGAAPSAAEAQRAVTGVPKVAGDRRSLGSTTRGKHNLNMTGDMPVAEKSTTELFNALDAALQSGAQPSAMRAAYELARHLGAEKPRIATQNAVVAAFIMVKHPRRYASVTAAASANSASTFAIAGWKIRIADAAKRVARARSAHEATRTQVGERGQPAETTAQAEAALVAAADELEEELSSSRHRELSDLNIAPPAHTCASACAKDGQEAAHVADTDGDAFLSMNVQDDAQRGGVATAAQMEACHQALLAAQEKDERLALEAEREDSKRHAFPLHPRMHSPCTNATLAMLRGAREERAQMWMARITAAAELRQSAHHVPANIEQGALPRKRNESDAQLVLRITEAYQQEMQLDSFHFHDIWGDHDHAECLRARYTRAQSQPTAARHRTTPGAADVAAAFGYAHWHEEEAGGKRRRKKRDAADLEAAQACLEMQSGTAPPSTSPRPSTCDPATPGGPAMRFPGGCTAIEESPTMHQASAVMASGKRATDEAARAGSSGRLSSPAHIARAGSQRAQRSTSAISPVAAWHAERASPRLARPTCSTAKIDDEVEQRGAHLRQHALRSTSPQPSTAALARQTATRDIANQLASDDSKYALCADRPELLRGLVIDAGAARDAGIPHGTSNADEWGFRWVRRFAESIQNPWMRPREAPTAVDQLRETYFTIMAIMWIAQMMAPSSRRRQAGFGQGKPTSALLAVYAWRRVMRDCGRWLPDMAQTRGVLKGICARYKLRWGDDAFLVQRKQPFTTAHLTAIAAALTSAAALASAGLSWAPVLVQAMLVAFCYAISTGARKDEWTATFEGDTFSRRINFTWVDGEGRDLPSTPAVIASRRNGHLLRGRSAPSKCDRLNIEWGSKPMWFRYDDTNPLNFAWRWQQWEMAHPCTTAQRATWPAFSPHGNEVPFTGTKADACMRALLAVVMTAMEAAARTWHSCRITLATRLFAKRAQSIARDEIEGVIQSLVRWKTPEAMRIYARMQPEQYADYVDMAANLAPDGGGGIPADLPEVDPENLLADHERMLEALEADAAHEAKAERAAKRPGDVGAESSRGRAAKRRQDPTTGRPMAGTAEPAATMRYFDIGGGQSVQHAGCDSWGLIGQALRMHNSFWGLHDDGYSDCRVVGFTGRFTFADGTSAKHAYIIECEGHHYPARHSAVLGALTDAAVKRRLRKSNAQPRLV